MRTLSDAQIQGLEILSASRGYVMLIIIATLISLHSVDLEIKEITCGTTETEQCQKKVLPFLTNWGTLIALIYFYSLTRQAAESDKGCNTSANLNSAASTLTLMAVLIRLYDLLYKA